MRIMRLKKIMCIIFYMTGGCAGILLGRNDANLLTNVSHHKRAGIEFGSLSFYFSNLTYNPHSVMPKIEKGGHTNIVQSKENGEHVFMVFFPEIKAGSQEIHDAIKSVNGATEFPYKVAIESLKTGLKVSIAYDPNKIEIKYDVYNSIKLQQGAVITVYNKELIKHLDAKSSKSILTTVSAKKPQGVVIDCGHGGKDIGSSGFFNLVEKDLTLDIGLEVAHMLKKSGFEVQLTRNNDATIPIDQRTSYANFAKNNDLLVSIHANFAKNEWAHGIETFFLDPDMLKSQFTTFDRHGNLMVGKINKERSKKNSTLANAVHNQLLSHVQKKNPKVKNRKVKTAVSQVLLGACMPAVLIEIGFLSNQLEAQLLSTKQYKRLIAQGICQGILEYFNNACS